MHMLMHIKTQKYSRSGSLPKLPADDKIQYNGHTVPSLRLVLCRLEAAKVVTARTRSTRSLVKSRASLARVACKYLRPVQRSYLKGTYTAVPLQIDRTDTGCNARLIRRDPMVEPAFLKCINGTTCFALCIYCTVSNSVLVFFPWDLYL